MNIADPHEMNVNVRDALIKAVWDALNATDGDKSQVRDVVKHAIGSWSEQ